MSLLVVAMFPLVLMALLILMNRLEQELGIRSSTPTMPAVPTDAPKPATAPTVPATLSAAAGPIAPAPTPAPAPAAAQPAVAVLRLEGPPAGDRPVLSGIDGLDGFDEPTDPWRGIQIANVPG